MAGSEPARAGRRLWQRSQEPNQAAQRSPAGRRRGEGAEPATGPGPPGGRCGQALVPAGQRQPGDVEHPAAVVVAVEGHQQPPVGQLTHRLWLPIAVARRGRGPARAGAAASLAVHPAIVPAGGGVLSPMRCSEVSLGSSQASGTSAVRLSISNSCRAWR